MTGVHKSKEWMRVSRQVRKIVDAQLAAGNEVRCIGCGWPIMPDQRYDVGHRIDDMDGGSLELSNLGPQHRGENRRAGGRRGAAITNRSSRRARRLPSW